MSAFPHAGRRVVVAGAAAGIGRAVTRAYLEAGLRGYPLRSPYTEAQGVSEEAIREGWLGQVSLRTFIEAEDMAALVLFLTSDAGAKMSGQAVSVDGHTEGI